MTKTIIHYYWALSDWAYFGFPRLLDIAEWHGAQIDHRPVDLPWIYERSGGILLEERGKHRQDYRFAELERWRERLDMPLNLHPKYFPANTHLASQLAYAAKATGGDIAKLSFAILKAMWVEDRKIDDEQTLIDIATTEGFDAAELLKLANSNQIEDTYRASTSKALEDAVFGSPFYIFENHKFWGQDRLFMLDEVLAQ